MGDKVFTTAERREDSQRDTPPISLPKFLPCSFIVLQHIILTPAHLHHSLGIKDTALAFQKAQQQETGRLF